MKTQFTNGDLKSRCLHRMGRLWQFRQEEVDEWVKSGGAGEAKEKHNQGEQNEQNEQKQ